jgi:hypothetical protein
MVAFIYIHIKKLPQVLLDELGCTVGVGLESWSCWSWNICKVLVEKKNDLTWQFMLFNIQHQNFLHVPTQVLKHKKEIR